MKKACFQIILLFIISHFVIAQKHTISGYVEDAESSERLIGATIYNTNTKQGTAANEYGFYSITLPPGNIDLSYAYVGYASESKTITLSRDTTINIKLTPSIEIDAIEVSVKKDPVRDNQMGLIDVPLKTIKKLPVIFGEIDIMKSVQMMPGIKGGVEGTSGIYVRGGSPDQNLILIDGVPVYNINHLFGFFSVFNSEAISNFDVIKGGFPARYGGHLSSVIDVRMKDGNMQDYNTSVNIGLLSSSVMTEGPIVKDKCSFMFSARRSYLDLIAVPAERIYSMITDGLNFTAGYFFGDLNAKINYKFSDKDRLYLSSYSGKDKLYFNMKDSYNMAESTAKRNMNWGNMVSALRWNHIFTPRLFSNTSLTYSKFKYHIGLSEYSKENYYDEDLNEHFELESEFEAGYNTSINDLAVNTDLNYIHSPNYNLRFGLSGIYHMFNPGITASKSTYNGYNAVDTSYGNKVIAGREFSAYIENNIKLGSTFSMNIGGRLTAFQIKDTLFISPEPRISIRAMVTDNFSLKASYSKMKQYVNLLTSTSVGFPTDIWIPSTNKVLPQNSTQYSMSANFKLFNKYDFVVEGYYKDMNNLVEYKEGASLFLNFDDLEVKDADMWENKVTQGIGWSYGVEFLLRKDFGKLNGWAGYTLSWANRKFDAIDDGKVFPFTYDRRHDIAIAGTYKMNDKIDFGFNWVLSSGNAMTLATSNYLSYVDLKHMYNSMQYNNGDMFAYQQSTDYYEKRNNFRMPMYQRLDLGVNFTKEKKLGTRILSLGVYNAYCHMNPFMVEVYENYENNTAVNKSVYAYSLFNFIPSISYHFKFK